MKKFRKVPLFLIALSVLIAFGCKKKKVKDPDPVEVAIANLTGTSWIATSVTLDSENRSADFTSFVLTLTENKTYSTSGVDPIYSDVWPASGTWDFKAGSGVIPDLTTIVRDGGLEISIDVLSDTQFVLSFEFVTGSAGRTSSTEGAYIFNMEPN